MKRILSLILMFGLIMTFSACQKSDADVTTGTAENITTTEKEFVSTTEDEEATSGTKTEAESTSAEANDNKKETTSVTNTSKNETTTAPVTDYIKIENNKVEAPAYELEIPDDFEIKSDDEGLLLENKKGTIQFNIMDKTDVVTDFDAYVSKAYNSIQAIGATAGELEDVVINDINMKRFAMTVNEDGEQLEAYGYLAQIEGRTLMITLTSKDGGLADVAAADGFVAKLQF